MEKRNFANFLDQIYKKAKKERWVAFYDKNLDFFSWTKRKFSDAIRRVKFSQDAYLYVTTTGNIEGIAVEYFKFNFTAHNDGLSGLTKAFTEKVNNSLYTIPKTKKEDAEKDLVLFATALKSEVYKEIAEKESSVENVAALVEVAVKCKI